MARLKREVRCIIVYHKGGGQFDVESATRPGQFHSTDLFDKTCSCERFTMDHRDKGKPCRHLRALVALHQAGRLQ